MAKTLRVYKVTTTPYYEHLLYAATSLEKALRLAASSLKKRQRSQESSVELGILKVKDLGELLH